MAGWSMLSHRPGLDCDENKQCQNKSCFEIGSPMKADFDVCDDLDCVDNEQYQNKTCFEVDIPVQADFDVCDELDDKKRYLLYRTRSVFLKDVACRNDNKPIPPMLGDGSNVDLFKLFWVVRERGGFDVVSKKGMWASVAEDLGFCPNGLASGMKLIYIKYLIEIEQWVQKHLRNECLANGKKLDKTLVDCKIEILNEDTKKVCDDDEKLYDIYVHYENDLVMSESSVAKKVGKRKRGSLFETLKWVMEVAKHPIEYAAGAIPKGSKWKECDSKELEAQALRAREVLLLPRHVDSNTHKSPLQNKLRMHPSMYEDPFVLKNQSTERLRCSKRFSNSIKGQLIPKLAPDLENFPNEEVLEMDDLSDQKDSSQENSSVKYTLVGPNHQADIPEWTGRVCDSDLKWLGTRIWPMEGKKDNALIKLGSIGKGRKDSCNCKLPGSVGCIRFHVSEKRMMLKLEVGSAFYHWNFHCLGEEVSLRWTSKEEQRFKDMVSIHRPSLDMCFWDSAFKYFPRKKRKNLVSYYFNVFTVRRRSYQNRVNPKAIDSDDDESDFGSFSEGFGHETVKVLESERLLCAQNEEYIDLE